MARLTQGLRAAALAAGVLMSVPASLARADTEKVLNVYNRADYIGQRTIEQFEQATGIKVNYEVYGSRAMLETKLLAGQGGYDVVILPASLLAKLAPAGLFRSLDKSRLPNLANLDPALLRSAAALDPGNEHALPYFWGTIGIGYNTAMVRKRMAGAPVDSLDIVLKPALARKFADCGIAVLDSANDMIEVILHYLGKDPYSANKDDYKAAENLLKPVRRYIKYFSASRYVEDLASGQICLALGWSGDVLLAHDRALQAGNGNDIAYRIPKQGSQIWIDDVAIPADAPHPDNALLFINFLMDPMVAAESANFANGATPVKAALAMVKPDLRDNPDIYPPAAVIANSFPVRPMPPTAERLGARSWSRIKIEE
jgi:putrescine transport system substrate-binding protein